MNMKHKISVASILLVSVFATGCSQQQVQQASAEPEAKTTTTTTTVKTIAPVTTNPDCHTHPRNAMTKSVQHCHKNPQGKHRYGAAKTNTQKSSIDVRGLQTKLKAKGYYKGPINGVINQDTRDALKKFQTR